MLFKVEALYCPVSDHPDKNNNPTSLLRSFVSHLLSVMTARATSLPKTKFIRCKRLSARRKSKKTLDESWPIFCRFAVKKSLNRQMHFLEQVGEAVCRRTAAWRSLICPDNAIVRDYAGGRRDLSKEKLITFVGITRCRPVVIRSGNWEWRAVQIDDRLPGNDKEKIK